MRVAAPVSPFIPFFIPFIPCIYASLPERSGVCRDTSHHRPRFARQTQTLPEILKCSDLSPLRVAAVPDLCREPFPGGGTVGTVPVGPRGGG